MASCDCFPAAPDNLDASPSVKHFQDAFFGFKKNQTLASGLLRSLFLVRPQDDRSNRRKEPDHVNQVTE
jgi:hypothetical protein